MSAAYGVGGERKKSTHPSICPMHNCINVSILLSLPLCKVFFSTFRHLFLQYFPLTRSNQFPNRDGESYAALRDVSSPIDKQDSCPAPPSQSERFRARRQPGESMPGATLPFQVTHEVNFTGPPFAPKVKHLLGFEGSQRKSRKTCEIFPAVLWGASLDSCPQVRSDRR